MAVKRISYIDEITGEVLHEGQLVWQAKRSRSPFGKEWLAMAQTTALDIARVTRKLGAEAASVMMFLIAKCDFENYVHVPQTEMGEVLKMRKENVSRAMRKLIEIGIVIAGPRSGRTKTYRLNPHFVWRGSTNTHRAALKSSRHLRIVRRTKKSDGDELRDPNTIDIFTAKTDAELEREKA